MIVLVYSIRPTGRLKECIQFIQNLIQKIWKFNKLKLFWQNWTDFSQYLWNIVQSHNNHIKPSPYWDQSTRRWLFKLCIILKTKIQGNELTISSDYKWNERYSLFFTMIKGTRDRNQWYGSNLLLFFHAYFLLLDRVQNT